MVGDHESWIVDRHHVRRALIWRSGCFPYLLGSGRKNRNVPVRFFWGPTLCCPLVFGVVVQ